MSSNPLHRIFNRARIDDRLVNELVGICHGTLADGKLCTEEILYLQKWLAAHAGTTVNPVLAVLLSRIEEVLVDGVVTADESVELMETLRNFSGGDYVLGEITKSTTIPLDAPPPSIAVPGSAFCFTGTFAFGSRNECEAAVTKLGGLAGSLTKKTNYLVIGCYATDSWVHSSYGRKIEKACELRAHGCSIAIISEDHWLDSVIQ